MNYAHLSDPHPEWKKVAEEYKRIEEKTAYLYALPIEEFRKVPYKPAPLSKDAPVPGQHVEISERQIPVRDGTEIGVRIYRPLVVTKSHVMFFNIHGGGKEPRSCALSNSVDQSLCRMDCGHATDRRDPESPDCCSKQSYRCQCGLSTVRSFILRIRMVFNDECKEPPNSRFLTHCTIRSMLSSGSVFNFEVAIELVS